MKSSKKIVIIICSILIIVLICLLIISKLFSFELIGDKNVYVNINSNYFENGYEASILGKEVKDVKVESNVDETKLGDYYVKYTAKFLMFTLNLKRNVHVVDREYPELTLNGETFIYLDKDSEYEEAGYSAHDNLDGDITSNVKVDSNLDVTKIGKYEIKYSVSDKSGNESSKIRTVQVIKGGLLTASIGDFWLKGSFDDVILDYEDKEYDYFNNLYFLGDSNTLFLHSRGDYVPAERIWGKYNLNISEINSSTFVEATNNKIVTLNEVLDKYKPKYLIVTPGIGSVLFVNKNDYINELEKFVKYMKDNYKDVNYTFMAIFPIATTGSVNGAIMKRINDYNYYLLEICHKYKINFINFTDEIRNEAGYADDKYVDCLNPEDCGFHLSDLAKEKLIDYIKHLNLERKVS